MADYGAVLTGRVIALSLDEDTELPRDSEYRRQLVHARVEVLNVWKGPRQAEILVETNFFSFACGFPFKLGERYLIYASGQTEPYHLDLCSPTKLLSAAMKETKGLDQKVGKSVRQPSN